MTASATDDLFLDPPAPEPSTGVAEAVAEPPANAATEAPQANPFIALAAGIEQEKAKPKAGRIPPEVLRQLLGAAGLNPDDFGAPRPLPAAPDVNNPEFADLDEFEIRLMYEDMDDRERVAADYVLGGRDAGQAMRRANELALEETQRDIDKLVFKPDDPAAIALDLGMLPALPHFEALLKTPEGQKHLEDRWVEMQTERITGEKSNEYLLYAASAIEADDAVLAADLRRRHEDMYGGAARAAWNLGKDFVFGAERYIGQGLHGAANRVARFLAEAEPDRSGLRRRFPYGPLSVEEQAELDRQLADRGPFWEAMDWAVKATESQSRLAGDYWSRPEARTGSFVYDKALSPVAADIGSAVGAILAYSLNPALGIATMFGASKMEIYDEVLAETGDRDSAHLVSDIGGAINAILERVGIEKITAGWKPYSPGMAWFAKSVVTPFASEGITETAQSGIGSLAKEAARARQPGGEVSVGRVFKDWEKWVAEGIYGGATGGLLGAAGGGPLRAAASHIEWRRGQAYLDGMIERLSRMPGLKNAPDKIKALVNDSVRQSGAPATMFQSAEAVGVMFQDRPDLLEGYLAEADVTREEFDHAVGSNQDIEVDASGLARWQAAHQADMPDVSRLARISPDAPSMAALVAEREDMAAIAGEFNRLQRENQTLPEPFRIFREQVTDSTGDHKLAADAADMVFAMSRVAGARMGLTPEQYLNLRPIQVTLQNALERARSANDIVADMDAREFAREATAAQKAFTLYQDAAKPRVFVESPAGGLDFGAISQEMASTPEARAEGIVAAPIRLEEGFQEENRDEGHKGYGRAHINAQISEVMAEMGYSDASEFVQAIVADPTAFYQADRNRYMVAKENGKNSIAIIELVKEESGGSDVYTVITAGVRKRIPKRYKMLWSGSASPATTPGASSVLASESGVSPGPAAEGALDAKASIPTIPAKGTDVNAWNQAVLYRQGRNMPGEVVWDGSAGQQQDSGDPARISYRDPQNAGTDAALRNSGQTASSINSIPAEGADVNAWNRDALDNLLRQSGVSEEQADIFRQYVESLLQSGEDVIDAQALGRDLTAALASAEGLEQAAAGLERILADPASITDAVFRAAGVEAPTGQQGIAELQRRMADLRKRADEFRTFYKSPETLSRVRQATAGDRGQRGDASLTPDVSVIRLFNGRQDRSTIFHELFHVYFHGLEQAAKAEGAPEQVRADYETLNAAVEGGLTATDPDARTAAEERAATMFERYLSEGRAPTPFLADAFARLRTWMANIYRNVGAFVGLDVSPEVRGVFDRMLAGEAEIAYARQYYDDLKTLSAPEGATEAQKRDIDRKAALARTTSEERHIARMVREYLQAEGNKDVGPGVMERIARLGGLDEMYVRRIHGDEAAAWLREQYGDRIFRRKGGDYGALVVAERLGYDSVRAMLEDIAEAQSYRDAVNAATDRMVYEAEARIRAAMLEDAPTPADADYHSDEYSDVFAAKQRVLDALAAEQAEREGRRAGGMMTDRAIRTAAYENNARKKQKKAVQYHSEVEAFKRHAGNAARAEAKGDNIKAAEEYRLMRMAHYGIRAALEARRELDRKLNSGEL